MGARGAIWAHIQIGMVCFTTEVAKIVVSLLRGFTTLTTTPDILRISVSHFFAKHHLLINNNCQYIYKTNWQECYGTIQICDANTHYIIPGYIGYPIKKTQNNSHNSITRYLSILAGSEPKYHTIRLRIHTKSQDRARSKAQL